jgi:hypothetical protein
MFRVASPKGTPSSRRTRSRRPQATFSGNRPGIHRPASSAGNAMCRGERGVPEMSTRRSAKTAATHQARASVPSSQWILPYPRPLSCPLLMAALMAALTWLNCSPGALLDPTNGSHDLLFPSCFRLSPVYIEAMTTRHPRLLHDLPTSLGAEHVDELLRRPNLVVAPSSATSAMTRWSSSVRATPRSFQHTPSTK